MNKMTEPATPPTSDETINLVVALRMRPLSAEEKQRGATQIAYKVDDNLVVLLDPGDNLDDVLRQNRSREKKYVFDHVLGADATQIEVYDATTKHLIDFVVDGYSATVFAYGATGAGKTHTMLGSEGNPGVMSRALHDLFQLIRNADASIAYDVKMSYLEIYNENIRDLLQPASAVLDLREDQHGKIEVAGLSEITTTSSNEILQLLMQGNRRRTQEPTAANSTSSRSHAVLQVTVVRRNKASDVTDHHKIGRLFLIDLAGSERAANTQNTGLRMKEGAAINRSLLALGNVINTLSEKGAKFVNYRDSKLTRLLKDSLGGNSRTVMIATISPASLYFEESRNTLIYAARTKLIRNKITQNIQDVTYHVTQYHNIISELRKEIARLKTRLDEHHDQLQLQPQFRSDSCMSFAQDREKSIVSMDLRQGKNVAEFTRLHDQLLDAYDDVLRLRNRIMELNDQAYDASLAISSKQTLLDLFDHKLTKSTPRRPWSQQSQPSSATLLPALLPPIREPDKISNVRSEVTKLESRLDEISRKRSEAEYELDVTRKKITDFSDALHSLAQTSREQKRILDLTEQLYAIETDHVVLESESLLTRRQLQRQNNALDALEKYALICDRLIYKQKLVLEDAQVSCPEKLNELYGRYENVRSYAHWHLLPLDDRTIDMGARSWNRDIVTKERKKKNSQILSKTLNYAELQQLKASMEREGLHTPATSSIAELPVIESRKKRRASLDDAGLMNGKPNDKLKPQHRARSPIVRLPELTEDKTSNAPKQRKDSKFVTIAMHAKKQPGPQQFKQVPFHTDRRSQSNHNTPRGQNAAITQLDHGFQASKVKPTRKTNRRVRSPTHARLPPVVERYSQEI